jgi:hypothetical protein
VHKGVHEENTHMQVGVKWRFHDENRKLTHVSAAIFLSIRVIFQSSYSPCVKTREVRYVAMKGSKSASGRLALGSGKGCQSRNIREWYGYVVPRKSVLSKLVSTCPRSSQVVNGGHIDRCCNYYQFIMKAEGMKNHGFASRMPCNPYRLYLTRRDVLWKICGSIRNI